MTDPLSQRRPELGDPSAIGPYAPVNSERPAPDLRIGTCASLERFARELRTVASTPLFTVITLGAQRLPIVRSCNRPDVERVAQRHCSLRPAGRDGANDFARL